MSTLSATIQADTSGFNAAIEKAEKELKQFDKTNKNLTDTIKKNNVVTDQQVKSFRNSISAMQKATSGANGYRQASSKLSKEIEKMKILYQSLNKEAQQGFFGTTLLKQIQATEAKVQQFNKNISKTKGDLKSITTNSPFKDMLSQVTGMISPMNSISSAVGKLGPAAAAAAGSFTLIKDAILESETSMDRMNGIVAGFKNAYSELLRMLRGESSNILGGFSLGMASYNASDALGTFLSLNAGWKAKLEEQAASLKLKKAEGSIISNEEFNKVKKGINAYYNKLIKYVKDQQQSKINQLIGGGSPFMKALVGGFVAAGDKDFYLNERKTALKTLEDKRLEWAKDYVKSNPFYNIEDAKELYSGNADIKDLQRFINAESTLLAPIAAIQADLNKADKERANVLKELQEVVSKEKTGSTTSKNSGKLPSYAKDSIADLKARIAEAEKAAEGTNSTDERKQYRQEAAELRGRLTKLEADFNPLRDMLYELEQLMSESGFYTEGWKVTPEYLERALSIANKYQKKIPEDLWEGLYLLGPKEQEDLNEKLKEIYTKYTLGTKEMEDALKEYNDYISRTYGHFNEDYESSNWWKGNIQDKYFEGRRAPMPPDRGYLPASKEDSLERYRESNEEYIMRHKYYSDYLNRNYRPPYLDYLRKYQKELTPEEPLKKTYQFLNKDEINGVAQAVTELGTAWSNLWSAMDTGNDTLNTVLTTMGSVVGEMANMTKALSANELAAAQAVALGKATASASGLPFPYNMVAIGTVVASLTSLFASFASIGKFAEGGIVGGNRSIGDYNIARVNSGEMILNGSQQKRLFHLLNSNGTAESSVQKVELVVRGKDLVGAIDNYNRQINRVR